MVDKEKRKELAKMIMEASKSSWFETIRHDDDEKALILVDEIIGMGWTPPQVELTPAQEIDTLDRIVSGLAPRPRFLADWERPNAEPLVLADWERELLESGGQEAMAVEWRDIDGIVGLHNFEISRVGIIRNKRTLKIVAPIFDVDRKVWAVRLILNGVDIFIEGPVLANLMWAESGSDD